MDLLAAFAQQLPIATERHALEFVPGDPDTGDGPLRATLRSIVWDIDGDRRSIRDIREQQVVIVPDRHRDDPRLLPYFEGWAAALRFVLERHAELAASGALDASLADRLENSMPSDLVFPAVLELRRPQTAEEFTDALLSSNKRLGSLLP